MRRLIAIALGVALALAGTVALGARNSSGTYSRPSGNPVTTGTPITSTWANALTSDIATELTDSLSRSGKGGMLAPLRTTDGSVSLPSLSFTNDTNTGLYRRGADAVGLSLGGSLYVDWGALMTTVSTPSYFGDAATFASSVTVSGVSRFSGGVTDVRHTGWTEFVGTVTADSAVTFLGSVFVPTPVTSIEAARKDYVDSYVGLVTTVTTDLAPLATHACRVDTITDAAASVSIPAGYDCENVTTAWTTGQYVSDWAMVVGTTATIRWCATTVSGDADPGSTTYRFRCFKP